MSYRRYPDRDRALSQLDRHYPPPPPSELELQAAAALQRAGQSMQPFVAGMRQLSRNAPTILERVAPRAARFIQMAKQHDRTV